MKKRQLRVVVIMDYKYNPNHVTGKEIEQEIIHNLLSTSSLDTNVLKFSRVRVKGK